MTESDLIVIAPWAIFGLGLLTVLLRLRQSRRSRPPGPSAPRTDPRSDDERHPDRAGRGKGREAR